MEEIKKILEMVNQGKVSVDEEQGSYRHWGHETIYSEHGVGREAEVREDQ